MILQDSILRNAIKKKKEEIKKTIAIKILKRKQLANYRKKIFNPHRTFYVCSYGGSGSTMLTKYLRLFGNVEHIHSRNPPDRLTYVGAKNTNTNTNENTYYEWFNSVPIPQHEIEKYTVIYIYRNPVDSILSRFYMKDHLRHIQCPDENTKVKDVLSRQSDLYQLEQFHSHYITPNKNRNYKIHCIKYENLFDNIAELNRFLKIPDIPGLYPVKKERNKTPNDDKKKNHALKVKTALGTIYKKMIDNMQRMPFLQII
jgi:hypothetical protein